MSSVIPAEIPVIDIGPFGDGDAAGAAEVAAAFDRACRDLGFVVVVGHGVPRATIDAAHRSARAFFDLDLAVRDRYAAPPGGFVGYRGLGAEGLSYSLDQEAVPDFKETYTVGRIDRGDEPYFTSQLGRMYMPDPTWPAEVPEFAAAWTEFYRQMDRVAWRLMRVFATALALPREFFDDKVDRNISCLRALNYPHQSTPAQPGQLRAGAHTDYGSLTLLSMTDAPGGLEVQREDGTWAAVRVPTDAFVMNVGDLMAQWTNDRWRSTMHRVTNPPPDADGDTRRQSLVFFHQPNYDAEVIPLASCCGPDNPPKYARTTSGEHLFMKMTKAKNLNV
ncbi:isopenicillin N synthase family dioxygenase [Nannocystis pusilla]|uniref:isopenicillin N synthase family dioxygenase n=1 Tax=Nannocystis pusilla TaxID=889268 RepID=UPI003DA46A2A